jgi:hypothetical protein
MPKPYAKHFNRSVIRPDMPARVKPVVDRIAELLETNPELRKVDSEVMRCALLTLSHRCGELQKPRWYSTSS